ncbi:MAG: hypothetical protein V1828_03415 [Candidatus Omnitrophota bacterium]
MPRKIIKILSLLLCLCLVWQQSGFAQIAAELNIAGHFVALRNSFIQDKFRPLHLRYIAYDNLTNNFKLLLDKGDSLRGLSPKGTILEGPLKEETKVLLNYFFIGISLPNDSFWVNLRPDSPDNIIDEQLAKTDVGRILLEADLQLKKDTAGFTSPETAEGKEYWDKLYNKAGEIFGSQNIAIPTLTRPWIVPDEIIIRETQDNAYIYKATLKVMLEQDYLKNSATYNFQDERLKTLNEYSSQLIRELIIPKLIREVNTAERYAPLRQVYYSLILAQWFKQKFSGKEGLYSGLIDQKNLTGLASKEPYSVNTYFTQYKKSFSEGEYNLKVPVATPFGQTIRSYMSGGIVVGGDAIMQAIESGARIAGSPLRSMATLNPEAVAGEFYADERRPYAGKVSVEVAAGSPVQMSVSSAASSAMVEFFKQKLLSFGATIEGLDKINPLPVADGNIDDLQWYMFEMPGKYLELLIKNNDIVAYGITTWMPQNTILRFNSFEKNSGHAEYWARIYRYRIAALQRFFSPMNKDITIIGVPTDQIISEDQLVKRVRAYHNEQLRDKNDGLIADIARAIINKVRHGIKLTDSEIKIIEYQDFEGFYSFGPAADFYVNKLGFTIMPTMAAVHKQAFTEHELSLLDKLKKREHLAENEVVELFSGRGLAQEVSSSPMKQEYSKGIALFQNEDGRDSSAREIQELGHMLGIASFEMRGFDGDRESLRRDLGDMATKIVTTIEAMLKKKQAEWKKLEDPSTLVPGDIVKIRWKNGEATMLRYNHTTEQKEYNFSTGEQKTIGTFYWTTRLDNGTGYTTFNSDDIKDGRVEVLVRADDSISLSGIKLMNKNDIDLLLKEGKAGWISLEDISSLRPGDSILETTPNGQSKIYRFHETMQSALRRRYGYESEKNTELLLFDMDLGAEVARDAQSLGRLQYLVKNVTPKQILLQGQSAASPVRQGQTGSSPLDKVLTTKPELQQGLVPELVRRIDESINEARDDEMLKEILEGIIARNILEALGWDDTVMIVDKPAAHKLEDLMLYSNEENIEGRIEEFMSLERRGFPQYLDGLRNLAGLRQALGKAGMRFDEEEQRAIDKVLGGIERLVQRATASSPLKELLDDIRKQYRKPDSGFEYGNIGFYAEDESVPTEHFGIADRPGVLKRVPLGVCYAAIVPIEAGGELATLVFHLSGGTALWVRRKMAVGISQKDVCCFKRD